MRHMEVPRLGSKSELQLLAYATAIANPHLSYIYESVITPELNTILDP